jgi:hypothetical protein
MIMSNRSRVTVAAMLLTMAAAATAQAPPPSNPGGMPEGPQGRPMSMGENDSATNLSAQRQIEEAIERRDRGGKSGQGEVGHGRTRPATAAEVTLGAAVRDKRNKPVGTIEMVDPDGAVVVTAAGKVKVPIEALGTDGKGLIIGITKAEFDKLVATANAAPAG